jgi:hypothetical protein
MLFDLFSLYFVDFNNNWYAYCVYSFTHEKEIISYKEINFNDLQESLSQEIQNNNIQDEDNQSVNVKADSLVLYEKMYPKTSENKKN